MKNILFIILSLSFICSVNASEDDVTDIHVFGGATGLPNSIKTYDTVMLENDHIYILYNSSVSRTGDITKNEKALWDSRKKADYFDEFKQPWKIFDIKDIEPIFGDIEKHYLIISPQFGDLKMKSKSDCIGRWPNFCTSRLKTIHFYRYKPISAAMVQWGCDYSLFTILDLGKVDPAHSISQWNMQALGSDSELPIPTYMNYNQRQILPSYVLNRPPYNSDISFEGVLLKFGDDMTLSLDHGVGRTMGDDLWFVRHPSSKSEKYEVIQPSGIFSGC